MIGNWDLEERVALVDLYMRLKKEEDTNRKKLIDEQIRKYCQRAENLKRENVFFRRDYKTIEILLELLQLLEEDQKCFFVHVSEELECAWKMYFEDRAQFDNLLTQFETQAAKKASFQPMENNHEKEKKAIYTIEPVKRISNRNVISTSRAADRLGEEKAASSIVPLEKGNIRKQQFPEREPVSLIQSIDNESFSLEEEQESSENQTSYSDCMDEVRHDETLPQIPELVLEDTKTSHAEETGRQSYEESNEMRQECDIHLVEERFRILPDEPRGLVSIAKKEHMNEEKAAPSAMLPQKEEGMINSTKEEQPIGESEFNEEKLAPLTKPVESIKEMTGKTEESVVIHEPEVQKKRKKSFGEMLLDFFGLRKRSAEEKTAPIKEVAPQSREGNDEQQQEYDGHLGKEHFEAPSDETNLLEKSEEKTITEEILSEEKSVSSIVLPEEEPELLAVCDDCESSSFGATQETTKGTDRDFYEEALPQEETNFDAGEHVPTEETNSQSCEGNDEQQQEYDGHLAEEHCETPFDNPIILERNKETITTETVLNDEKIASSEELSFEKEESSNPLKATLRKYIERKNLAWEQTLASILHVEADCYADISISDMNLSVRANNCLMRSGILSVETLLASRVYQIANISGMGTRSLDEILTKINDLPRFEPDKEMKEEQHFIEIRQEELKPYGNVILAGKWSEIPSDELSEFARETLAKIREFVDVLGEEVFRDLLQRGKKTLKCLEIIQQAYIQKRKKTEKVEAALEQIPEERRGLFAEGMLRAYVPTLHDKQERLLEYFGGPDGRIIDIKKYVWKILDVDLENVLHFLKWCKIDLSMQLETFFASIAKNPRDMTILSLRSKNATLQEAGEQCGITRERARQIEKKISRHFAASQKKLPLIISALRNGDSILTYDEMAPFLGEYADYTLYLLKITPSDMYTYSKGLQVFTIGSERVALQVENFVDSLPDSIEADSLNEIIERAEQEEGLPAELVEIKINEVYSRSGIFLYKGRKSLSWMYDRVMRLYYPEGLHIYDEEKMNEFREKMRETFGPEIKLPENNRAIFARLADLGVLCGRGCYRPKADSYISKALAKKIYQYILDSESPIVLYQTLFLEFKDELLKQGIDNRHYLHGVLGELYGDKLIFSRDAISRDANSISLQSAIVDFIRKSEYPVSKTRIQEMYPGVSSVSLIALTTNPALINCYGEYLHIDRLRITEAEKTKLYELLKAFLDDGNTHTSKEMYAQLEPALSPILKRSFIQSHFAFFSVCECLFAESFQFNRPYVAKNGVEIVTAEEAYLEYLHKSGTNNIGDLVDFANRKGTFVRTLDLLDSINSEYFIVNHEKLISIEDSGVTKECCRIVEEQILSEITQCTPIRSLVSMYSLPSISVGWTEWLVYSMLKKWSVRLDVAPSFNQFRSAIPLVAPKGKMDSEIVEHIGSVSERDDRFSTAEIEDFDSLITDILLEDEGFDELL